MELKKDKLKFEPILISKKKGELMPTANLSNTPFIDFYKGCGSGIAYVKEIKNKYYLVDFNYGNKINYDNLMYSNVEFSSTQVLFTSGIEKSLIEQKQKIEEIENFVKSLNKVKINGIEFYSCKNVPALLKENVINSHFGFVQQGPFEKKHKGIGFGKYVNILPQEGAYNVYIFDKQIVDFTFGVINNLNVINVKTIRLYNGNKEYVVFIKPNVKEIENQLNKCFSNIPQEKISEGIKARFIYRYNSLK